MQSYRLRHLPRLARVLIGRVLDHRALVGRRRLRFEWSQGKLCLDRLTWRRRTVELRGRNLSGPVSVRVEDGPETEIPEGDFEISLSRPTEGRRFLVISPTRAPGRTARLSAPRPWREMLARLLSFPGALRDILKELPAILSLMRQGDPMISREIQQRLGLANARPVPVLPKRLFDRVETMMPLHLPAIVLPVFNGFELLDPLLERLHDSCGLKHHLVLVDDGSDDSRIAPRLEAYARAYPRVSLIRQRRNQGFVHAANLGLDAAQKLTDGHLVLLNSDAVPPDGWLARLLTPILQNPRIASVTPLSNAAEILSVPSLSGARPLTLSQVQAVDREARRLSGSAAIVDTPTGIGFCMALNRTFVDRIGGFDPIFGRGYGEEVDWCQKARRLGGRHVAAANLFVGHHGAASFGQEARAVHRRKGDALISYRYPNFDSDVREWCRDDPLATARLVLSLAWLAAVSEDAVPVFVAHSLGGGAEAALRVEVAGAFAAGSAGVVVLRVGGPRLWRIEIECPGARQVAEVQGGAQLMQLMSVIPLKRLVFSCGVGSADPMGVPKILTLLADASSSFDLRVHDYLAISPSWTLLGQDGIYRGVPDVDTQDASHGLPGEASHRDWRKAWGQVLKRAREITVFSSSSAAILRAAYPGIEDRVRLCPHRLIEVPAPIRPGGQNIGILGSINRAKGAEVLTHLSGRVPGRRLIVIGEMDGRFRLPPPHVVHGAFDGAEISDLARRYDVGLWLIPSVWPETFSFATREALATGLPVLVFDLGAQAEAARAAPNGYVLTGLPCDADDLADRIEALIRSQSDDRVRAAS